MSSIFEGNINQNRTMSRFKLDKSYMLNAQANLALNTYATWTPQYIPDPDYSDAADEGKVPVDKKNPADVEMNKAGIRSIFNRYSLVPLMNDNVRTNTNTPLIDSPKTRQTIRENSGCTVKELVSKSQQGLLGRETYDYSDFMYCKYLGQIPNNYLITLRRFPIPVGDYINYPNTSSRRDDSMQIANSIGCLVTWLGTPGNDINSILTYNYKMPYKEVTAELQNDNASDESSGMLGGIFNAFNPKYQEQVQLGMAGQSLTNIPGIGKLGTALGVDFGSAPYKDTLTFQDANKLYGPVDMVKVTHMRDDKNGLDFQQSFSLQFDYELRAYSNINTRQAMLDLLSNILSVTYVAGDFWKGGVRSTAPACSDIFQNLKIMHTKGGFTNFVDAFTADVEMVGKSARASIEKQGGTWNAIKNLANNIGGMLLGGLLNKLGRPQKHMLNSLLSPAPIGLWHVTIGNPNHPIMSIGNLILDSTTIEHYGPLGLDDFPTGLRVKCSLKRGKGRDLRDIEKMYMGGYQRIYANTSIKTLDAIKSAPECKSQDVSNDISKDISDYEAYRKKVDSIKNKDTKRKLANEYASSRDISSNISSLTQSQKAWMKYYNTNNLDAIWYAGAELGHGIGKQKEKKK